MNNEQQLTDMRAWGVYGQDGKLLTTLYAEPETSHDDMLVMVAMMSIHQRERGWFKKHLVVAEISSTSGNN